MTEKPPENVVEKSSERSTEEAAAVDKPDLLLVEDTLTQAMRLSRLLAEKYTVKLARDGQDALIILESFEPCLILSDITMPEIDGYELCRRLKKDAKLSLIPFALMVFPLERDEAVKAIECGTDDIIGKIFDGPYLLDNVAAILKNNDQRIYPGVVSANEQRLANLFASAVSLLAHQNVNGGKR